MNYGNIIYYDVANGPGCRTSLFVSGCRHHCKGCFNACTWDFNYGQPYTEQTQKNILESLRPSCIEGLTILGGEPFEPENQPTVLNLLQAVKGQDRPYDVWIYSGYRFEELMGQEPSIAYTDCTKDILALTDILVDGEFIQDLKDVSLAFRGSRNQRLLDIQASLQAGSPILYIAIPDRVFIRPEKE